MGIKADHLDVPRRLSMKPPSTQSKGRTWLKRLLWLLPLILIPAVIYLYNYGPWIAYLLATGPLGGSVVVETDASCGDGEYRIVVYKYKSGDGHLDLTNRAGKVFDSAKYGDGIEYKPFTWMKNCKKVMVGSNDGLVFLQVK